MKKGPLSAKEKNFIKENIAMDIADIAESLSRSEKTVSNYIDSQLPHKSQSREILPQEDGTKVAAKAESMSLYARNKERGVVAMTEAASMSGDENKKSRKTEIFSTRKYKDVIHKIKED